MLLSFPVNDKSCKKTGFSTAQCAELQAIISACWDFAHIPFNLYTDSAYVCSMVKTIETSYIGHTSDEQLFHLFHELWHYYNNTNIFILWAISGPILAFLVHWQRATLRLMPWHLH
jgi:ribonuclease HI